MTHGHASRPNQSPGPHRGSLRAELLFNLGFLAVAALLLAAGVAAVASRVAPGRWWVLLATIAVFLGIFLWVGRTLIDRLVTRPLSEAVRAAEAIAGGDYGRRIDPGESRETAALAAALNHLTDQLLDNQEKLSENVRSLDETNRLLISTQRDLVQAEKMAGIGRLAAGVAHEIGNPLGVLLGYVSVLRRRAAVDAELGEGMERELRRIDRIVRSLLDYSRPGTPAAERERIDVNAAVRRAVEVLEGQGRLAEVETVLELADDLPAVRGDAHRLEQVFVNLVDNAARAMRGRGRITLVTRREVYRPERPVPVRRADDPPGVSYAHLRRKRYTSVRDEGAVEPGTEVVRVIVADTGPGIPPESIDAVFDPFFTTGAPGEGTGLGLAIVASTVSDLGGRIEVSSAEGGGAVFTLSFPIDRTET